MERALPTYAIAQGGITKAILNDRLNQLDNKLSSQIFSLSASLTSVPNSLPASGGVTYNIALSQHIDNLDGTQIARAVITDATITGGNVTATAFSGLLGVGGGGTGTSSAPSYGQMLVGNSAGGYDLLAPHRSASALVRMLEAEAGNHLGKYLLQHAQMGPRRNA